MQYNNPNAGAVGGSLGSLGSQIENCGQGAVNMPKQPTHFEMLKQDLDSVIKNIMHAEMRLIQVVSRAYGESPAKEVGGGGITPPAGSSAVDATAIKINILQTTVDRVHSVINKLENLV